MMERQVKVFLHRLQGIFVAAARSFRDGCFEIWNLFVIIAGFFDPRQIPRLIRRDTGAVIDSSKLVATTTTAAVADVTTQALLSPFRTARWLIHAPQRLFYFLITR